MKSRRTILGWASGLLASLVGVKVADTSVPLPRRIFAHAGERVTCEGGHHIATFVKTVKRGDMFDPEALGDFQQSPPQPGEFHTEHPCAKCGKFWFMGVNYHFEDGWR